ncbi:MAG: GTPase ObgE [Spirochaetia bacterium]|nr:GTPase ObgE [Spirochaetia bacterium]MCF7946709.1 GTPase ObgE [Spirochaetia bacterium]MCF7952713.1 GTPase ObgE [Spirochaetales bacterium]
MFGFSDETYIDVASGKGGNGCVSFRREKYVPRGGPDGGDGGKGGDVVFVVKRNLRTLAHLKSKRSYKAENGRPGSGRRKHGRDGENIHIEVPPGTLIKDSQTGELVADLTEEETEWIYLEGGKGGKGNWHYRTSTRQAPRYAQEGKPAQETRVHIELRIIADIGFVGYPNAGKTSLLNFLTNAHSKVAGYPFTTKIPNLGVCSYGEQHMVLADIPGIIDGASSGAGLGFQFLRHISRTSGIAYLIDMSEENFTHAYESLQKELGSYHKDLLHKPEIIIGTKLDLPEAHENLETWKETHPDKMIYPISVFNGTGIDQVKQRFMAMANE